jgi:riboflavin synthase
MKVFTGIVEEVGNIKAISNLGIETRITINAKKVLESTNIGDSISVNGICLTVTEKNENDFSADVMPETLKKSNLSSLSNRSGVNLERALKVSDRLGGHIVSGHIDGTGVLLSVTKDRNAIVLKIKADIDQLRYMIEKGSVSLDGVSLTIFNVDTNDFSVSIIPHSAKSTIIGAYKAGDKINIECDLIGKYVERLLAFSENYGGVDNTKNQGEKENLSIDFLKMHGF